MSEERSNSSAPSSFSGRSMTGAAVSTGSTRLSTRTPGYDGWSPMPRTCRTLVRSSVPSVVSTTEWDWPDTTAPKTGLPVLSATPSDHSVVRHQAETAKRASDGAARSRALTSWLPLTTSGTRGLVIGSPEDCEVNQPGAEAEDGAVQVEQPLVLLDRRPQHLREVVRSHCAHAGGEQVEAGLVLASAELGIVERRHRVGHSLGRERLADRVVLLGPDRAPDQPGSLA